MSNEVFANGNEIACKSGDGKVIAAFPDVCLSPPSPPAGPVPVPYPNTSFSKDMKNGSKSVKIDDKEVMLKNKSFYKTSPLGNEAATKSLGAGVVSHVITGKTYFVAWSMDIKFEGKNVDRHLDLTTSNHASPMPNEATPIPGNEGISKGKKECLHENIKREPEKGSNEHYPDTPAEGLKKVGDRIDKRMEGRFEDALKKEASGNLLGALKSLNKAAGLDGNLKGKRFEQKIAEETNAKEVSVKVKCRDCGLTLAEYDVVTEDGVAKECKADGSLVKPKQFRRAQKLAQRKDVFGPGTLVHLAIPAGDRYKVTTKFSNKSEYTSKIQEH